MNQTETMPLPALHPTQRRALSRRSSLRSHVPPPVWACALQDYVSGQCGDFAQVAAKYGLATSSVARQAKRQDWTGLRKAHAERLKAKVEQGTGIDGGVRERTERERAELGAVQTELARDMLAHGRHVSAKLTQVLDRTCSVADRLAAAASETDTGPMSARLRALSSTHAELAETLRVLAGIPHPDRSRRSLTEDKPGEDKPRALRVDDVSPISSGTDHAAADSTAEGGEGGGGV